MGDKVVDPAADSKRDNDRLDSSLVRAVPAVMGVPAVMAEAALEGGSDVFEAVELSGGGFREMSAEGGSERDVSVSLGRNEVNKPRRDRFFSVPDPIVPTAAYCPRLFVCPLFLPLDFVF